MTSTPISENDVAELRELLAKATAQDIGSATCFDRDTVTCPTCDGDGEVTCATYTNYDGQPQGVQFFGIGNAHLESATLFKRLIQCAPTLIALASQSQERDADGWRPIEAAPKDGTVIDLWGSGRFTNCRWGRHDEDSISPWGEPHWRGVPFYRRHGIEQQLPVTHWRPLPEPPRALAQQPPSQS